jgi:hypothetical protein
MTITATAPVRTDLNLADADTIQLTRPTLEDQVRHLSARGLGVVQIATRLDITAWDAFAAGAHICLPGDADAVEASMPPKTDEERAQIRADFEWWSTHTLDEIIARYDTTPLIASVMQDLAFESISNARRARLLFDQGASAADVAAQLGVSETEAIDLSLDDIAREHGWTAGIGLRPDTPSVERRNA